MKHNIDSTRKGERMSKVKLTMNELDDIKLSTDNITTFRPI